MRRPFNRFLLMLLMLVLPLQTFASATMRGCLVVHPAALEQVAAVDEAMAGCHEQPQDAPATPHNNCQHCAVCALASALPVAAIVMAVFIPDMDRFMPQLAATLSGFIPDGPERPPRTPLA